MIKRKLMDTEHCLKILHCITQRKTKEKEFKLLYDMVNKYDNINFSINDMETIIYDRIDIEALSVVFSSIKENKNIKNNLLVVNFIYQTLIDRILFEIYYDNDNDTIEKEEIINPVFIVGMPRTGSTFLHNLLSLDDNNRFLRTWEGMQLFPYPNNNDEEKERQKYCDKALDVLRQFVVSNMDKINLKESSLPTECIDLFSLDFTSAKITVLLPETYYCRWYAGKNDFRNVLKIYKKILKFLQYKNKKKRWVLKTPSHMQYFKQLMEFFPDSKLIHIHRDIMTSLASSSSLHSNITNGFIPDYNTEKIGQVGVKYFSIVLNNFLIELDRYRNTERLFDINYNDFISSPNDTLKDIYKQFGFYFSSSFKDNINKFLENRSLDKIHKKYGKHEYDYKSFDLQEEKIKSLFKKWYKTYGEK